MLRHKYGLAVFQDFLRSQYGEENLNFWLSVEEYKTTPRENKLEMARTIYEDYVSTLSPTEVGHVIDVVKFGLRMRSSTNINLHVCF